MDNRRKCVLRKLKTLLNLLEDEEPPQASYLNVRTKSNCCLERPPCPAVHQKYPIVPYRPRKLNPDYKIHECSPSTMLCINAVRPPTRRSCGGCCGFNGMGDCYPRATCRRKPPLRKSPKYYYIDDGNTKCDVDLFATRSRVSVKGPYIIPPRCTESMELRGGVQYYGCACQKNNGLQDKCERFCCLPNPCQRTYLRRDQFESLCDIRPPICHERIYEPEDVPLMTCYPVQNVSRRCHPYNYVSCAPIHVRNDCRKRSCSSFQGNYNCGPRQCGIYDNGYAEPTTMCVVYPMNYF